MANDPRDLDGRKLNKALHAIGRDENLRGEFVAWLKTVETRIKYDGAIRDDVTGPIVDALHTDDDCYQKVLNDGSRFEFLYRTKIAREFLLAKEEHPSHVWEPQTTRLLKYLAAETVGDILIGGAYFGDHALLLGRQLSGSGRQVHCFEPNTDQRRMLENNVRINELENIVIQHLGLWNKSSQRLRLAGFDSFANVVPVENSEDGFETISIDDYCKMINKHLGVIMLDIEGSELLALQGAKAVLQEDKPTIVFELHRDYVDWTNGLTNTPICTLILSIGYKVFAVRDFHGNLEMNDRLIELIPIDSVYLEGPPHGFNMLAVANDDLIKRPQFKLVDHVSPKLLRHKSPALHHPLDGFPL